MDRFDAMRAALAAADAGSLSAAARRLNTPLPTISRQVAELEARLGAQIFTRSARGLSLTDAGQDYVAAARRILEEVAEAERAAGGAYAAPQGMLAVSAPLVFGRLHIAPVTAAFLEVYPLISVRLDLSDRFIDFEDDGVDAAVRIGALADSALIGMKLGETRLIVCASPAYLAARGAPARPADVASHACVGFSRLDAPGAWTFSSGETIALKPRFSVNTAEAALDAAIAGVGLTRVFCYQANAALADGRLVEVLRDHAPAPAPITLLYLARARTPTKLRAFLSYVAPRVRARLSNSV
jgi:DNA-binding transcriptional LysR family regulator